MDALRWLAPIRKTALEQMDYEPADRLCQKMQGLFAEAYQPLGNLHVDCGTASAGNFASAGRNRELLSPSAPYNGDPSKKKSRRRISGPSNGGK